MLPTPPSDNRIDLSNKTLLLLAVVNALGFSCISTGFTLMAVSLAETLRAAEPIFSLVLSFFILSGSSEGSVSLNRMLALIPVMLGTALASAGSGEFSLAGVAAIAVANLCFSSRSVLTKRYHLDLVAAGGKKDPAHLFFCMNAIGFCLQV
jgi:drug/metabolite transporter (DMT)-like permease